MVSLSKGLHYSLIVRSAEHCNGIVARFEGLNSGGVDKDKHRIVWDDHNPDSAITKDVLGLDGNYQQFEFIRFIFLTNSGRTINSVDISNISGEIFSLDCIYLSNEISGVYTYDARSDSINKILNNDEYTLAVQ